MQINPFYASFSHVTEIRNKTTSIHIDIYVCFSRKIEIDICCIQKDFVIQEGRKLKKFRFDNNNSLVRSQKLIYVLTDKLNLYSGKMGLYST